MLSAQPDVSARPGALVEAAIENRHRVDAVIRRRVSASADHDHVWSNVLLKAWQLDEERRYGDLDSDHAEAIVLRIAGQRALNARRDRSTAQKYVDRSFDCSAPTADPAAIVERQACVGEIVESLGADAELILESVAGFTSDEIASRHGFSSGAAVRQRTRRRLDRTVQTIKDRWEGGVSALVPPGLLRWRPFGSKVAEMAGPLLPALAVGATVLLTAPSPVSTGDLRSGSEGGAPSGTPASASSQRWPAGVARLTSSAGPTAASHDVSAPVPPPYRHVEPAGRLGGVGIGPARDDSSRSFEGAVAAPSKVPLVGGTVIVRWSRNAHCDDPGHPDHQAEECAAADVVRELGGGAPSGVGQELG